MPVVLRDGDVESLRFGPGGEGFALVVHRGDAKSVGEIERGQRLNGAVETYGLFDVRAGDGVFAELAAQLRRMGEGESERGRDGFRLNGEFIAKQRDGFGEIDRGAGAIAAVAADLRGADEGFSAADGVLRARLLGGLFVEALGFVVLAFVAGRGGAVEERFEGFDQEGLVRED